MGVEREIHAKNLQAVSLLFSEGGLPADADAVSNRNVPARGKRRCWHGQGRDNKSFVMSGRV